LQLQQLHRPTCLQQCSPPPPAPAAARGHHG
jgi:hypothetical protein